MAEDLITQPRDIPAVEELLQDPSLSDAIALLPRPVAAQAIRGQLDDLRRRLQEDKKPISRDDLCITIGAALHRLKRREITRVINATGILVHTNLGRAPLADSLFEATKEILTGYSNLEFDLSTGQRGSRGGACESYLAMLAEAEAATVVNNCAAALFLILNTLANRKSVLISRGELVQIGGGFRIPEILKRAGARLREVGTTNITTLADYEDAVDDSTALILKVHKSNFVQAGFTEEVPLKPLVELGRRRNIPVLNDLGSGVFLDTGKLLGYSEPTVQQSVRSGAALTCFSGDKLLGGVQAGLIVGQNELIRRLRKNPLYRTVRVDKVVFATLERLLTIYLNGTPAADITLWSGIAVPESERYKQAKKLLADLGHPAGLSVEATRAYVGGGSLPESEVPSVGVVFAPGFRAGDLLRRFRDYTPPIIGRVESDRFILDLAAVETADLPTIAAAIRQILAADTTPS